MLLLKEGTQLPIAYLPPPHIGQAGQTYGEDPHFLEALGHPPRSAFCPPFPIDQSALRYYFDPQYIDALESIREGAGKRTARIPFDPQYIDWSRMALGTSARAAQIAVENGLGISRVGGFHHAHFNHGADFCVYSDVLYLIQRALQKDPDQHIVVFDTDAHVADGLCRSIKRFKGHATVYDLHSEEFSKFVPKDASKHYHPIAVPRDITDHQYLIEIRKMVDRLQEDAKSKPVDLIIFISGYDMLAGDKKGRMNITPETTLYRDMIVYEGTLDMYSPRRGMRPHVIWLPGGGYTPESDAAFGRSVVWGVGRLRAVREEDRLRLLK